MKTLFLLRHAKSDWKDVSLKDFDRPLNKRGRQEALLVGDFVRHRKIVPDLILCSPAERARQTILIVSESAGFTINSRFEKDIYDATVARLLETISQIEDAIDSLLLVGHNPGLEELLSHVSGQTQNMQTATLANISLDVTMWNQIREGRGRLEWLLTPRDIPVS